MNNLLRFQPFPLEVFPDSLAAYCRQAAASVDCDESMLAVPMLSVIATAVGSSTRLEVKPDWQVPSIIWTCTVAKSGSAKSPAMKLAVRFLRKMQDRFDQEHELAAESHRPELLRYEAGLKQWKSDGCQGDMPAEPAAPVHRRILTSDGTLPAVSELMSRNSGGLLYFADELAGWLGAMTKFSNGDDSNAWNELFDGQSFWHDRKVAKSLRVRFPALSVTGGIQPERVFTCFSRDNLESGLAARVLFFKPPARERKLTDISIPRELTSQVGNHLEALAERQPSTAGSLTWEPDLIGLEREAFAEYRKWHDRIQKELAATEGPINAALAKLTGTALRVALILFCYRYPNAVQAGRKVDVEAIRAGITISDWFANEAARMYQANELGVDDRLASEVLELLQSFGPSTLRDMQHRKRILREHPADQLEKVVAALVPEFLEMEVDKSTGGRPCVVYRLKAGNGSQKTACSEDLRYHGLEVAAEWKP